MVLKCKNEKNTKLIKKPQISLDTKHTEIVSEFELNESILLPNLKKKKNHLKSILKKGILSLSIEKQMELKEQIKKISEQITLIKNAPTTYYLENAEYLFDYFSNKKKLEEGTEIENCNYSKTKMINDFFKINTPKTNEPSIESITEHANNNLVLRYLRNVSDDYLNVNDFIYSSDLCQACLKGELIRVEEDGILVCKLCSRTYPCLTDNDKPSYKDPPKEASFYAYRRINHFKEILAQFQAKETTQIPENVIEDVKKQIKKERIELSNLTYDKTKDILKILGYNKYYEHINFIKAKLGIKPPIMSLDLEERLCKMFVELQAPYSKLSPDNRVNFLGYYYTAYKLCELLNEKEYLKDFPMLKDVEKRMEQDATWKKICLELNWKFIPTS